MVRATRRGWEEFPPPFLLSEDALCPCAGSGRLGPRGLGDGRSWRAKMTDSSLENLAVSVFGPMRSLMRRSEKGTGSRSGQGPHAVVDGGKPRVREQRPLARPHWRRGRPFFAVVFAIAASGCGQKTTTRMVDDPSGQAIEYGAPHDTTYVADWGASGQHIRISVFENSRCDVIPVTVMQRYQETLHGDEVVQRAPVTKKQVAGDPQGDVPCNQTYARNVEVLLEMDGNRVSLGKTNAEGRVKGNLARLIKTGGYETTPEQAQILLRPNRARPIFNAGVIELKELDRYEERVTSLLAQLEKILAKGETGASPEEITRSYEIYSQLQDIAPGDPRVQAVSARFWELFYGRKQEEARERLGRNLDELGEAQDLLKTMGDAAIPIYVQAAVSSGVLDRRALEWSSLRLVRALRSSPSVCSAGFSFSAVPTYGWPTDARLAARYVAYGYGKDYSANLTTICSR